MNIDEKVKKESTNCTILQSSTRLEYISNEKCIQLIKEACKKQREECLNFFNQWDGSFAIINAPEPTWEE